MSQDRDEIFMNKNVLIVDDEEQNLYLLEVLLKSKKCKVTPAGNGVEALECLKRNQFDLIISDILMPKMDGFQFCRVCRSDSRVKDIPLVFYTATYTDKKDEEFALSLGADRFLVKPMEPEAFIAVLREVLQRRGEGIVPSKDKILKGEEPYLVEYNERIIRKLENKMVELDEAHKLLVEQEEKYRSIFEQSRDPIILCGRDFAIIDVNQAAVNLFGFTKEELLAVENIASLCYEPDEWVKMLGVLETNGYASDYEMTYRRKDGTKVDSLLNVTSRLDQRGWVVNYQGIIRDVTDRKRAEGLLRESEERFRITFERAGIGIVLVDKKGHALKSNPALHAMLGYAGEELAAMHFTEFVHPDDVEGDLTLFLELLAGKRDVYRREERLIAKDGRIIWIDLTVTSQRGPGGDVQRIIAMMIDISERKRVEAEINRLNEDLEQRVLKRTQELDSANKELEAFSYSVSHDLRAPLRGIAGFSRALAEDYADKLDAEAQRLIKMIQASTGDMGVLIEDLLDFSRLGRKEMSLQPIDMRALAEQVFAKLQPAFPGLKAQAKVGALPPACGDYILIQQVFVNLLSNAMKFTAPREEALIEVGGREEENEGVYYVKDNGVGFDMKYVDKLFGVFQRLHSRGEFEGTGIGLALVQRIIHRHSGRVWAEGRLNEGATFYFSLPKS